jgi:hypothetical protein
MGTASGGAGLLVAVEQPVEPLAVDGMDRGPAGGDTAERAGRFGVVAILSARSASWSFSAHCDGPRSRGPDAHGEGQ